MGFEPWRGGMEQTWVIVGGGGAGFVVSKTEPWGFCCLRVGWMDPLLILSTW
jgi:hypothetical protein